MFIGLLNRIDLLYLTHCEKKLQEVQHELAQVTRRHDNLIIARKRLLEVVHVSAYYNVVFCDKQWINLEQADRMIKDASIHITKLTREDYEKYGTARTLTSRRLSARNTKVVSQRSFGSTAI